MFSNRRVKYFGATNGYEILLSKLMFYIFKIFGLAPISYDCVWIREKNSWSFNYKFSWYGIIYNVALISLSAPASFIIIFLVHKSGIFARSKGENYVFTAFFSLYAVTTILTLIVFVLQHDKMTMIANEISKLRQLVTYKCRKRKFLIIFVGNFITALVMFVYSSFYSKRGPIFAVSYEFPGFLVYFLLIQYTLILDVVKNFYQYINSKLLEVLLRKSVKTVCDHNLELEIDDLIYLNSCLYSLSKDISDFYRLPMIWTTLDLFIILLLGILVNVEGLFFPNNFSISYLMVNFVCIYLSILALATLVVYVTNTTEEVCNVIFDTRDKKIN